MHTPRLGWRFPGPVHSQRQQTGVHDRHSEAPTPVGVCVRVGLMPPTLAHHRGSLRPPPGLSVLPSNSETAGSFSRLRGNQRSKLRQGSDRILVTAQENSVHSKASEKSFLLNPMKMGEERNHPLTMKTAQK